jgi:hypothetical protein
MSLVDIIVLFLLLISFAVIVLGGVLQDKKES